MATATGSTSERLAERPAHGLSRAAPYVTRRPGGRRGKEIYMRGILLWAIGVPIPIIILIYLLF
jgi:hypothetical protein